MLMSNVLYRRLFESLGCQELTADQLHGQINATWEHNRVALTRVRSVLRSMVSNGTVIVSNTMEATGVIKRFRVACDMYRADQLDGARWGLIRFDPSGLYPTTIGAALTEAEAKTCATALNELDRKARGFKAKP
jgi:hypothetical protein